MSEGFTCCGCGNLFFQAPKCVTCGAQKLYDSTVKSQGQQIEAQAAEITRLRAALATARREGMEASADLCDNLPDHQGEICAIAIRMMIDEEDKKAAIRAAAKEVK